MSKHSITVDEFRIVSICNAYESGYGDGWDSRKHTNPWKEKSAEWFAWDYGYSEGKRKSIENTEVENSKTRI